MPTYLLSMPIMPVMIGTCYEQLPLHCTLFQYFETDEPRESIARELRSLCGFSPSFQLTRGMRTRFGPQNDIPVFLVQAQSGLHKLHWNVLLLLRDLRARILNPEWAGDGYRPHVTIQGTHPFLDGATVTADHAVLVERVPEGKLIRAKFPFA